jgi:hypothetical protein
MNLKYYKVQGARRFLCRTAYLQMTRICYVWDCRHAKHALHTMQYSQQERCPGVTVRVSSRAFGASYAMVMEH